MSASKPFILPTSKPGSIASRIKDLQGGDSDSRDLIRQYKPTYKDFTPSNSYRDRDSIFSKNSFNSSNQRYRESSVPKIRESFMSSRIERDLVGKESNSAEKSRSLDSNSSGVYSNRSFPQGSTQTSPSSSTPLSSTPSSSRSTPPPSTDTTSSFRWSDRMKSSPPFNRRTSAEPKKISALTLRLVSSV
ncbi:putative protein TPRXL [Eurytemora carolleeae]|uniref:putative protein TPRXL n=1 Tax=Eurytemora carolleeae TaxID=1294199 RepID=UPI000C772FCF|nr:putative protein TPRXL [Eurytemora carolleeae]|eukprot:XP_023333591.1 putative protein TPRXL [Eurytemora affinis]